MFKFLKRAYLLGMSRLTTAASQTAQTDNITRFNVAKLGGYFSHFIHRTAFPYSLRLLEVFNVITCTSFLPLHFEVVRAQGGLIPACKGVQHCGLKALFLMMSMGSFFNS